MASPPLLEDYSIDELKIMTTCIPEKIPAPFNMPSNTQAVERIVKEVMDASKHVGPEQRDGYIRSRVLRRQVLPEFEHKGHYRVAGKVAALIHYLASQRAF